MGDALVMTRNFIPQKKGHPKLGKKKILGRNLTETISLKKSNKKKKDKKKYNNR